MRVHAKILDKTKLSILIAGVMAYASSGYYHGGLNTPRPILPAIVDNGKFNVGGEIDDMFGLDLRWAQSRIAMTPTLRPLPSGTNTVIDPSSLHIINKMSDDTMSHATGTIVSGSHEFHRIVSVGHALITNENAHIEEMLAFDGDGRFLAMLRPVVSVLLDVDGNGIISTNLMNDMAVFEPIRFSSDEARAGWNARGATMAGQQYAHPLLVLNGLGDETLNKGMSGSTIKDHNGEIVGVLAMSLRTYRGDDDQVKESDFAHILNMQKHDLLNEFADEIDSMMYAKSTTSTSREAIGLAAPILHPDILSALGVPSVSIHPDHTPFVSTLSGFPGMEAATSTAYVTPMPAYSALALIDTSLTRHYADDVLQPQSR